MALIATQPQSLSNWLKHEYNSPLAYCREVVQTAESASDLLTGVVLGKITATGVWAISKEDATDGSEVPAGIVYNHPEAVAALGTSPVLVLFRGPASISELGVILDASFDDATKKAAAYAALEALGIQVLPTV